MTTAEIQTPAQGDSIFLSDSNLTAHGRTAEIDLSDRPNPLVTWKVIPPEPSQAAENKPKPRESYKEHELWPILVKREHAETVSTLVLELSSLAILVLFWIRLLSVMKKAEKETRVGLSAVICVAIVFLLLTIAHTVPGVLVPEVEAIHELEYILREASSNSVLK